MKRALPLIGILIVVSVPAQALFGGENRLAEGCRSYASKGDMESYGECVADTSAIADILAYGANLNLRACIPLDAVKSGQMIAVVNKSLRDHPIQTDDSAMLLVAAALRTAFPCQK